MVSLITSKKKKYILITSHEVDPMSVDVKFVNRVTVMCVLFFAVLCFSLRTDCQTFCSEAVLHMEIISKYYS